jgi:hypothetical protein
MSTETKYPALVQGAWTGLKFPASIEALREQGCDFLTTAFHATGALSAGNRVVAISQFDEFHGGGAGRKLRLSVEYAQAEAGLHRELFVKFPRDFGDPLRDMFSALMEPETRFALLSRQPDFPVAVPRCYFADYDPQTSTGLLITERIAFGRDGIEPFQDKCLDYELQRPLEHYRALVRVVAKLSGQHKAGRLGAEVDRQFPFDVGVVREHDRIPHSAAALQQKIEALSAFARRYPGLLPDNIRAPEFLERLAIEAQQFLAQELAIKRFLNLKTEFIALSHWNANVDNAWFCKVADGTYEAGLLDWGSVGQMNIAQAFYGVLCAAEVPFWNAHKDQLLALFASEYQRNGGPAIDVSELDFHLQLYVAMLGLAWMITAPEIIESQAVDLSGITSREDPRIKSNFLARAQLQLMTVFLNAWQAGDFGAACRRFERLNLQTV